MFRWGFLILVDSTVIILYSRMPLILAPRPVFYRAQNQVQYSIIYKVIEPWKCNPIPLNVVVEVMTCSLRDPTSIMQRHMW
jgi:hypothetical protein